MSEDLLHPRQVYRYSHAEMLDQAVLSALSSGRMHHAWLLCGPEGMGKASYAYRLARYLLGGRASTPKTPLAISADDPEARLIAGGVHPDLLVLERLSEGGKTKKAISVDQARSLSDFFSKAPSRSAYRVAIIDAVDELNINSANALLKTLEEPPERGVILLVCHAPGRIMATLRSRCRRLNFPPWPVDDVADFCLQHLNISREKALDLANMAKGSPGQALRLQANGALAMRDLADLMFSPNPPETSELQYLADGFRKSDGGESFALWLWQVAERLKLACELGEISGPSLQYAYEIWSKLIQLPSQSDAINLDRGDAFWSSVNAIEKLQKSH